MSKQESKYTHCVRFVGESFVVAQLVLADTLWFSVLVIVVGKGNGSCVVADRLPGFRTVVLNLTSSDQNLQSTDRVP